MHRSITLPRRSRLMAPLLAAGALAALPAQSHALEIGPTLWPSDRNPTCQDIQPLGANWKQLEVGIKVGINEASADGLTVKVNMNGAQKAFSWTSNKGVDAVIAKGGPNANIYNYVPEGFEGNGLHAPLNQNEKDWYGMSHIWVCYDGGDDVLNPPPPADPPPPVDPPKPTDPGNPVCVDYCGPNSPYVVPPAPQPTSHPDGDVLSERQSSGRSKLTGPTGCLARKSTATVTGRNIRRVTFMLDGKRVKTVKAAAGRKRFTLSISRTQLKTGTHRLVARVAYTTKSATKAKTHKLAFQRCAKAAVAPRFTG